MMINFSVKPSSYTGASDTNGGGYVDGLGATYANFCSSSAGPLYTNIEPTTYGYDSTGLYDITHSMTVPTGVICYCRYADDSASTTLDFYAYLVNADNWQMVYLPVGKTGISSQAVIDDAISNAEAGDELLLLAVGGALATWPKAVELQGELEYFVLLEGEGGVHEITAEVQIHSTTARYTIGVMADGSVAYPRSNWPAIKAMASMPQMLNNYGADNYRCDLVHVKFDANNLANYCIYGGSNSSSRNWLMNFNGLEVCNAIISGICATSYPFGNKINLYSHDNGSYGYEFNASNRNNYEWINMSCYSNGLSGVKIQGPIGIIGGLIADNTNYGIDAVSSYSDVLLAYTTMDNAKDIHNAKSILAYNSIINGSTPSTSATSSLIETYCADKTGLNVSLDTGMEVAPPFIATGTDLFEYYALDSSSAEIATYYRDARNQIGALGIKATTGGGGGTGVCNLIGNGGMIE